MLVFNNPETKKPGITLDGLYVPPSGQSERESKRIIKDQVEYLG